MGSKFKTRPSELLGIADDTVAMAVDVAATFFLCEDEAARESNLELIRLQGMQLLMMGGSAQQPEVEYTEVYE